MNGQHQRGQSLTEFTVVAVFLLIPLFLLIPSVAQIISQSHDTQVAARYAAWERTVWYDSDRPPPHPNSSAADSVAKPDTQVAHEIDARIFSRDTDAVFSGGLQDFELDPFARRMNVENVPLLLNTGAETLPEYAEQSSDESEPPGGFGGALNAINSVASAVGVDFRLNRQGVFEANVAIPLVDLSGILGLDLPGFDQLKLRASNTIFAEAWEAGGTEHAKYLVSELTVGKAFRSVVNPIQQLGQNLPWARELDPDCLYLGYSTIEPVPGHRLMPFEPGVQGIGDDTGCSM